MRNIRVDIDGNGIVYIDNKQNYKGEHNNTVLSFVVDASFEVYSKFLFFETPEGSFWVDLEIDNETEFDYAVQQNLSVFDVVKCCVVFKEGNDIIGKSDVFDLYFKDSINASVLLVDAVVTDFRI